MTVHAGLVLGKFYDFFFEGLICFIWSHQYHIVIIKIGPHKCICWFSTEREKLD